MYDILNFAGRNHYADSNHIFSAKITSFPRDLNRK